MANPIESRIPTYLVCNKKTLPFNAQPMTEAQIKQAIDQAISALSDDPDENSGDAEEMQIMSTIAPAAAGAEALAEGAAGDTPIIVAKLNEAAAKSLREQHANLLVEPDADLNMLDMEEMMRTHGVTSMVPLDADTLRIRVKVVSSDGKAIAKARVSLSGEMWFDHALAGSNGVAELKMLGETLEA